MSDNASSNTGYPANQHQPNFLHAGDHVHLGPGVTGTRQTNPAVDLEDLPHIDAILLSHYHAYVPLDQGSCSVLEHNL